MPDRARSAECQIDPMPSGGPFAEIVYEFAPGPEADDTHAVRPGEARLAPQSIAERAADPIRQRFYMMRGLAGGNPRDRHGAAVFYRQARFMADFTDDYWDYDEFSMYYPCYQMMSYGQLRTYFTWRARVREGSISPTPLSYVFVYVYELLCGIGVEGPLDGLDALMAVWQALRGHEPSLDNYLPQWLKDYHVYYQMPVSFDDFVSAHGLRDCYPELYISEEPGPDSLALLSGLSSYAVAKSRFLGADMLGLYEGCLTSVLEGVGSLARSHGLTVGGLLSLGVRATSSWSPFPRALFHDWLDQPDRTVELPGGETFTCRSNHWTSDTTIHAAASRDLIGYLMKRTEAALRQVTGFKYRLTANPGALSGELERLDVALPELDSVIDQAVAERWREANRTVVTVDLAELARIRTEAYATQGRLAVADADAVVEPPAGLASPSPIALAGGTEGVPATDDPWSALAFALSPIERDALAIALHDGGGLKAFADSQGMMLEVLCDKINEKAFDLLGDTILELTDTPVVHDEYKRQLEGVIR
jgi:hypothetical protein